MSHLKSKKIIPLLIDQFKDHHILRALFGIKKIPTTPPVEIKEELKIRDHHKSRRCSVILFTDQLRGHQRFLSPCGKESTHLDDPEDYQVLMGNERKDSSIPVTDQLRGHQRFLSPCSTDSISSSDPKDYQVLIGNEERTSSVPVTDQLRGHQRFLSPCSTSISCIDPKDYQVLIGNEERISPFPVTDHLRNHQRFLSPCESRKATEVSSEDLPVPHLESQLSQRHQG